MDANSANSGPDKSIEGVCPGWVEWILTERLMGLPFRHECIDGQCIERSLIHLDGEVKRLREALVAFADSDTESVLRNMLGDNVQHDCSLGTGTNVPSYHTCMGCWFDEMFEEARKLLPESEWKYPYGVTT